MKGNLSRELRDVLAFEELISLELVQELWSGYGGLFRAKLSGSRYPSVIIKRMAIPRNIQHPRSWNTEIGHERKLKSYQIERYWYEHYNSSTHAECRTPQCLGIRDFGTHSLLVLEDLDSADFHLRKAQPNTNEIKHCLSWLAHFHALFMQHQGRGLWSVGTYWHLETRPNEWEAMPNGELKQKAGQIDQKLNLAKYQCLVHGDAKFANFCFADDGRVAAVDFQYVGKGCGIKDVVYLFSGVRGGLKVQEQEALLSHYFSALQQALNAELASHFGAIEKEWRYLYPFAWADFERFLQGWAPGHWKSNPFSLEQCKKALSLLRAAPGTTS